MCWQRQTAAGLQTLYLFANAGNTPTPLRFSYTKGLERRGERARLHPLRGYS
ncbi:MAG TPA: hypothetical protein VN256_21855 [Pyrinomonadaceae bacterium]|nr:hypothetical protein [Pyrinomonadaceae bacterium]